MILKSDPEFIHAGPYKTKILYEKYIFLPSFIIDLGKYS